MQRMTWFSVLSVSALALAACGSSNGGGTTKGSGGSAGSTSSTGGKSSSSTGGTSTSGPGGAGGSTTSGPGGAGGSTTSATGGSGGSTTSATGGSATGTGGSSGNTVQLTVKDYLSWCSVTVGANAASSLPSQTVSVPANSTVSLSMTPLTGFDLGNWHHTAGDTGNGDPGTVTNGTSKTSVDVTTGTACVWVCCPTHGLPDDCPTTDQCP